jgi:hypothetical protein
MEKTEKAFSELGWEEDEINLLDEIGSEDYVFVVNSDGMVKSMLLPEVSTGTVSAGIEELMEFFKKRSDSTGHTLH